MINQQKIHDQSSLWSDPLSTGNYLDLARKDSEYSLFFLCGLYCGVGIFFLVFFGVAALLRQELSYAYVIFGFAIATLFGYIAIWVSGHLFLAKHLVVILLGMFCLYLFHTGGTERTGPIYFFIFPTVAVLLQGFKQGAGYTILLLCCTVLIYFSGVFDFDSSQYSFVFISRVLTIYFIISMLVYLFAYSKQATEEELLLSLGNLEKSSSTDSLTGLANRNFMEKMLVSESKRFKRYKSPFCIMMFRPDSFDKLKRKFGYAFGDIIMKDIAIIIGSIFRSQDIPCRWEREEFIVLLPESARIDAQVVAERLLDYVRSHSFFYKGNSVKITLSIGLGESSDLDVTETLNQADRNLFQAIQNSGNCIVNQVA